MTYGLREEEYIFTFNLNSFCFILFRPILLSLFAFHFQSRKLLMLTVIRNDGEPQRMHLRDRRRWQEFSGSTRTTTDIRETSWTDYVVVLDLNNTATVTPKFITKYLASRDLKPPSGIINRVRERGEKFYSLGFLFIRQNKIRINLIIIVNSINNGTSWDWNVRNVW